MTAAQQDFVIMQGESINIPVTITSDGVAVDLTSATLESDVKTDYTDTAATVSFTMEKTDAAAGKITHLLTATQTWAMAPGNYVYDSRYKLGADVTGILRGTITIHPGVTQL